MTKGTVRWFDAEKGFGFIGPDGGGKDVFVHYTEILDGPKGFKKLAENQRVEFVVGPTDKGPQATGVTAIEN